MFFSPLRPVAIPKKNSADYRPLLIPTVADRVVQRAILNVISPSLLPHVSSKNSHAFQRSAGVRSAVMQLKEAIKSGAKVIVFVDVIDFFSSIDAERLFIDLNSCLSDTTLDHLLRRLQQWEIKDLPAIPYQKRRCFPMAGKGVPQGSALSPLLSNFYLRDLDRESLQLGMTVIRYADDVAIACKSQEEALSAFEWLRQRTAALGLTVHDLNSKKSRIVEVDDPRGLEYLGFHMSQRSGRIHIRPTRAAIDNAINEIEDCFDHRRKQTLSERYLCLSHFLNSWLGTYGHVCGVERERAKLLRVSQRGLSRLLVHRGLLSAEDGLTREQREFLGIESIFAKAELRRAVQTAKRMGRKRVPVS